MDGEREKFDQFVGVEFDRLEESINRMNTVHADALRAAVEWFNEQPQSESSIAAFQVRVIRIADNLSQPLTTPRLHSVRVSA